MSSKKRILIVDDEPEICEIIAWEMQNAGFDTVLAYNGKDALEAVRTGKVDAVISDIKMPGGDGIALLDSLKKLDTETPVLLFVTGFSDLSIEDAYDRGAEGVFSKPIDFPALLHTVTKALQPKDKKWARAHARTKVSLAVELIFPNLDHAIKTQALSFGRGGMFLAYQERLPKVGEALTFKIALETDAGSPIQGDGIVRWVRDDGNSADPRGLGIEFNSLSEGSITRIAQHVATLKHRAFIPRSS